jgi:hypothetical protein
VLMVVVVVVVAGARRGPTDTKKACSGEVLS